MSDVAENVFGQKWTETDLELMEQWLDAYSSADNLHMTAVAVANVDSGLSGKPAVFSQQPSVVAQCHQSASVPGSANAVNQYTVPGTVTGTQNSVQYSACQLPGGQLMYVIFCTLLVEIVHVYSYSTYWCVS